MQGSAKCQHVNFRIQGKRTMRPIRCGTKAPWTTLPVTFPLRFSNSFMMVGQWSVVSDQLPFMLSAYCLHCIRPQALVFQLSIASFAKIQGGSGIISMFESELTYGSYI